MEIIERGLKEAILIKTPEGMVRVWVYKIAGDRVRLAFGGPKVIPIVRQEIYGGEKK